jgi:squalene-hopene/tetraprenyl-beta-curcumene cyclase
VADLQLHELYPAGTQASELGQPRDRRFWTWPNFFLRCDRLLKLLHELPWKPWRTRALARAEAWMIERMGEGSDGIARFSRRCSMPCSR